jgi:hypothetical protein
MGITAAGTVPDSHRIPFHHGGISHQIALFGCKDTNNLQINNHFPKYFVILQHEAGFSHSSTYQRLWQNNDCQGVDGALHTERLQGAAIQVRARLYRHEVS